MVIIRYTGNNIYDMLLNKYFIIAENLHHLL